MGSLLPVGVLFFSSYFSPSPRVSICLFFFFFQFQSLCFGLLNFILDPFTKVFYGFNSVLKLQFVIYCFFTIRSLFFWFLIWPLAFLLEFYWFSILFFNQSLCFFLFQFSPHSFDFFSFVEVLFFNLTLQFIFLDSLKVFFLISVFTLLLLIILFISSFFFRLHPSVFDMYFGIRFHIFCICHAFDLIIWVTSFKC